MRYALDFKRLLGRRASDRRDAETAPASKRPQEADVLVVDRLVDTAILDRTHSDAGPTDGRTSAALRIRATAFAHTTGHDVAVATYWVAG